MLSTKTIALALAIYFLTLCTLVHLNELQWAEYSRSQELSLLKQPYDARKEENGGVTCNMVIAISTCPSARGGREFLLSTLEEFLKACPESDINVFTCRREHDNVTAGTIDKACRNRKKSSFFSSGKCKAKMILYSENVSQLTVASNPVNYWRIFNYHARHYTTKPLLVAEDDVMLSAKFRTLQHRMISRIREHVNGSFVLSLYNPGQTPRNDTASNILLKRLQRQRQMFCHDFNRRHLPFMNCIHRGQYTYGAQAIYFSSVELVAHFATFLRKVLETPLYADMLLRSFLFDDNDALKFAKGNWTRHGGTVPHLYNVFSLRFSLVNHLGSGFSTLRADGPVNSAVDFVDDFPGLLICDNISATDLGIHECNRK